MNILIVTPFSLNSTGGVSTAVLMWNREFQKRKHKVMTLVPGETNCIHADHDNTECSVYGVYLRSPYIAQTPFRSILSFCVFLPFTLFQLYRFLTNNKIEIVSIQYPLPWMFYFAVLRRFCKWKLVITYQGNDAHDLASWTQTERWLIRFLLAASDRVVGVSASLLDKVRDSFPDLNLAYVTIPNGAPVEAIAQIEADSARSFEEEYIITIGHLIHRKGVDIILRALGMLRKNNEHLRLVVVGDGPDRSKLMTIARENGVEELVCFAGNQSHDQTISWLKGSLFFVLASRAEGLPLVLAEALACQKAVVATAIDGIPDIIRHQVNGILVPTDDPSALAEALLRLYKNNDLRTKLAARGYESVFHDYSWGSVAEKYIRIYEECWEALSAS